MSKSNTPQYALSEYGDASKAIEKIARTLTQQRAGHIADEDLDIEIETAMLACDQHDVADPDPGERLERLVNELELHAYELGNFVEYRTLVAEREKRREAADDKKAAAQHKKDPEDSTIAKRGTTTQQQSGAGSEQASEQEATQEWSTVSKGKKAKKSKQKQVKATPSLSQVAKAEDETVNEAPVENDSAVTGVQETFQPDEDVAVLVEKESAEAFEHSEESQNDEEAIAQDVEAEKKESVEDSERQPESLEQKETPEETKAPNIEEAQAKKQGAAWEKVTSKQNKKTYFGKTPVSVVQAGSNGFEVLASTQEQEKASGTEDEITEPEDDDDVPEVAESREAPTLNGTTNTTIIEEIPKSVQERQVIWSELKVNKKFFGKIEDGSQKEVAYKPVAEKLPCVTDLHIKQSSLRPIITIRLDTEDDIKKAVKFADSKEAAGFITRPRLPALLIVKHHRRSNDFPDQEDVQMSIELRHTALREIFRTAVLVRRQERKVLDGAEGSAQWKIQSEKKKDLSQEAQALRDLMKTNPSYRRATHPGQTKQPKALEEIPTPGSGEKEEAVQEGGWIGGFLGGCIVS